MSAKLSGLKAALTASHSSTHKETALYWRQCNMWYFSPLSVLFLELIYTSTMNTLISPSFRNNVNLIFNSYNIHSSLLLASSSSTGYDFFSQKIMSIFIKGKTDSNLFCSFYLKKSSDIFWLYFTLDQTIILKSSWTFESPMILSFISARCRSRGAHIAWLSPFGV